MAPLCSLSCCTHHKKPANQGQWVGGTGGQASQAPQAVPQLGRRHHASPNVHPRKRCWVGWLAGHIVGGFCPAMVGRGVHPHCDALTNQAARHSPSAHSDPMHPCSMGPSLLACIASGRQPTCMHTRQAAPAMVLAKAGHVLSAQSPTNHVMLPAMLPPYHGCLPSLSKLNCHTRWPASVLWMVHGLMRGLLQVRMCSPLRNRPLPRTGDLPVQPESDGWRKAPVLRSLNKNAIVCCVLWAHADSLAPWTCSRFLFTSQTHSCNTPATPLVAFKA